MEGIDVFVKIGIFVTILAQCKEGQEFRSLEVRGKLIALKNFKLTCKIQTPIFSRIIVLGKYNFESIVLQKSGMLLQFATRCIFRRYTFSLWSNERGRNELMHCEQFFSLLKFANKVYVMAKVYWRIKYTLAPNFE